MTNGLLTARLLHLNMIEKKRTSWNLAQMTIKVNLHSFLLLIGVFLHITSCWFLLNKLESHLWNFLLNMLGAYWFEWWGEIELDISGIFNYDIAIGIFWVNLKTCLECVVIMDILLDSSKTIPEKLLYSVTHCWVFITCVDVDTHFASSVQIYILI